MLSLLFTKILYHLFSDMVSTLQTEDFRFLWEKAAQTKRNAAWSREARVAQFVLEDSHNDPEVDPEDDGSEAVYLYMQTLDMGFQCWHTRHRLMELLLTILGNDQKWYSSHFTFSDENDFFTIILF